MSSIASQLKAMNRSALRRSRPGGPSITRPSVPFGAKEAADINLRVLLPIALSGFSWSFYGGSCLVWCLVCIPEINKKRDISGDIIKEVRDFANTTTASTYFRGITQLLDHSDSHVKRKTLGMLSEIARRNSLVQKQTKARKPKHNSYCN